MRYFKAKIYWKDNPELNHTRTFAVLEAEDNLEEQEHSPDDDQIFFYVTEGEDEVTNLQKYDNGEDFVIVLRSVEYIDELTKA